MSDCILLKISQREVSGCLYPHNHIKPCRQSSSQDLLLNLRPPVCPLITFPWVVSDSRWLLCPLGDIFRDLSISPIFLYRKTWFYSSFYFLSCTLHPALNTVFEDIAGYHRERADSTLSKPQTSHNQDPWKVEMLLPRGKLKITLLHIQ